MALVLALAACRGEPVPRDYQNQPPAAPEPQPGKGAEGQNITRQPISAETPSPKLKDQAPAKTTT